MYYHLTILQTSILLIFLYPYIQSVPNPNTCEKQLEEGICIKCTEGYILSNGKCFQCADKDCLSCQSLSKNSCKLCPAKYFLINSQCGLPVSSSSLPYCTISTSDNSTCLKCKFGCPISNGQCKCTGRITLSIIIAFLIIVIIGIVAFYLIQYLKSKNLKLMKVTMGDPVNQSYSDSKKIEDMEYMHPVKNDSVILDTNPIHKADELIVESSFEEKNKQVKRDNEENEDKKNGDDGEEDDDERPPCDYCLIENGNFFLSCGCSFCSKDKKLINDCNNECPACKNKFDSVEIKYCGLCNRSKKAVDICMETNCGCKLPVCKGCYSKWNKHEVKCPGCNE